MDDIKTVFIASHYPASDEGVQQVLNSHVAEDDGHNDGRSSYFWMRLANGDLVLGVFPQGDTYFEVEHAFEQDYRRAERAGKIGEIHLSKSDLRDQGLNVTDA